MANKKNNENKKNNNNNQEGKVMKKNNTKLTINLINGIINITAINGEKCKEVRRFGTYTKPENGTLPHISIRPKVGGWLELDVKPVYDENGIPIDVEAVREEKAYWALTEQILGGKKAVKSAIKTTIELRKSFLLKKAEEAKQETQDNGMVIGATKNGYIYQKPMADAQTEIIDLGKFGKRTLRYGKGLECSKVLDGDKEVAYIFWKESGKSPRIRLLSEEQKRYYMLSYNQDNFFYYEGDKQMKVNDQGLRNALWFFHKNFVVRLAELKGWKLPEKKVAYYQDNGYWDSLEKEHEQEEAAIEAARQARKNSKGSGKV